MRNISILQFLVLLIVCFLLFGDFNNFKKKLSFVASEIQKFFKS